MPVVKELKVNNDILMKLNKDKPFFLSEIPRSRTNQDHVEEEKDSLELDRNDSSLEDDIEKSSTKQSK